MGSITLQPGGLIPNLPQPDSEVTSSIPVAKKEAAIPTDSVGSKRAVAVAVDSVEIHSTEVSGSSTPTPLRVAGALNKPQSQVTQGETKATTKAATDDSGKSAFNNATSAIVKVMRNPLLAGILSFASLIPGIGQIIGAVGAAVHFANAAAKLLDGDMKGAAMEVAYGAAYAGGMFIPGFSAVGTLMDMCGDLSGDKGGGGGANKATPPAPVPASKKEDTTEEVAKETVTQPKKPTQPEMGAAIDGTFKSGDQLLKLYQGYLKELARLNKAGGDDVADIAAVSFEDFVKPNGFDNAKTGKVHNSTATDNGKWWGDTTAERGSRKDGTRDPDLILVGGKFTFPQFPIIHGHDAPDMKSIRTAGDSSSKSASTV